MAANGESPGQRRGQGVSTEGEEGGCRTTVQEAQASKGKKVDQSKAAGRLPVPDSAHNRRERARGGKRGSPGNRCCSPVIRRLVEAAADSKPGRVDTP